MLNIHCIPLRVVHLRCHVVQRRQILVQWGDWSSANVIRYSIIAEPKGEASNRAVLSPLLVCMYIRSLRNEILCLCMYIHNTCTIQSYAHVCVSVTLMQCLCNDEAKMSRGEATASCLEAGSHSKRQLQVIWPFGCL